MKIFGYEFRKFEEQTTTIETVETWVVEWEVMVPKYRDWYEPTPKFKTFVSKDQAEMFKKELQSCIDLLGDQRIKPKVYKQEHSTNA
ncbi:hypothetical protein [Alteromonas sp. BMJM2]|uniref:hypothetical protein n=1 Tax=Alteromonas sp. BMJM2 TaxID=2954241 RepID=UPI0022B2C16C|nr:hypothetical protein [Alteromonas sp. BMJM2]